MKKLLSLFIVVLLSLSMVSCNNAEKEAIKEGKTALEGKNYKKAFELFSIAKDKKTKDEEAIIIYDIIDKYYKAKTIYENTNFDEENLNCDNNDIIEAKKIIDSIPEEYNNYAINKDINGLNSLITEKLNELEEIKEVNKILEETEKLFDEKKYFESIIKLKEIRYKKQVASHQPTLERLTQKYADLDDELEAQLDAIWYDEITQ